MITTDAPGAYSIHAADVDGDGDQDVMSTSASCLGCGKIAWYENQIGESGGDGDGFGDQQVISIDQSGPVSLYAADIDGDGDSDALSASSFDGKIAWYENKIGENGADGDGFGDQQVIIDGADGSTSVHMADIDGDGDPDVVSAVAWHENQLGENGADGDGFGDQQVIVDEGGFSTHVVDVNGDGKVDILSSNGGWYENRVGESGADGDGFGDQQVIINDAGGSTDVHAADIDGDWDSDPILSFKSPINSSKPNKIAWYRNNLKSILAEQSVDVSTNGEFNFGTTGVDINFSGVGDSGEVTVTKFDSGPTDTTGISESSVSTYRFMISAEGSLAFDSSTQVQLDVSTLGGIDDASKVTVYQRPNDGTGEFTNLSASFDSGANELIATVSNFGDDDSTASFGEFVLASNSEPLPVELSRFETTLDGKDTVRLTWTTASETGNAGFRVQRKIGEKGTGTWTTVGSVEGGGTTTDSKSYRYVDEDLPYEADRLTYRLKQVDTDGSASYSKEVTVNRSVQKVQLLGTYPNPARQRATVRYALPEKQNVTVRLYDTLGRMVQTVVSRERKGRHKTRLNVGSLPSGTYFLRLEAERTTKTQRLTVVR